MREKLTAKKIQRAWRKFLSTKSFIERSKEEPLEESINSDESLNNTSMLIPHNELTKVQSNNITNSNFLTSGFINVPLNVKLNKKYESSNISPLVRNFNKFLR